MATKVICYACASSFGEGTPARHSAAGDRVCPACGSDFIEVADVPPLPPPRPPGAEGGAGPGPGRPQFFTAGPGMFGLQVGGGGLDGLPHMMVGAASEHLLGALREHLAGGPALHGARVVLQYGGLEPGLPPRPAWDKVGSWPVAMPSNPCSWYVPLVSLCGASKAWTSPARCFQGLWPPLAYLFNGRGPPGPRPASFGGWQ